MFRIIVLIFCVTVPALSRPEPEPLPLYVARFEDIDHTPHIDDDFVDYRLPKNTVPRRYTISLTTNIHKGEFEFSGTVLIDLMAVTATKKIVIHQRELTILDDDIKLTHNGVDIKLAPSGYDNVTEFFTINLDETETELIPNELYKLEIKYTGTLRGDGADYAGFYRSNYTNPETNENVWLATTQFESTDARHGFPCYDEPHLKAIFVISITHGINYEAVSNAPVISNTTLPDDMITTNFDETPKMSTYLIAYIVSDYQFKEQRGDGLDKIRYRVYAAPHLIDQVDFALEAGALILENLANITSFRYPIAKMDQFGIPQFSAGAMENWGLVTYRISALHWTANSAYTQKRGITTIVGHEFAHQWFGNLVSPEWWDYIWLNEGFATIMQYVTVQHTHPEYKTMDLFVTNVLQNVFQSDSLDGVRPMTYPASSPVQISRLFDNIAYDKSGSVLRMFMFALSEEIFFNGIYNYLDNRKYDAANTGHLSDGLQKAAVGSEYFTPAEITMTQIMNSWTTQPGFPVVSVSYTSEGFMFKQARYLSNSLTDPNNYRWFIPLNYVTKTETASDLHMTTTADFWMPNVSSMIKVVPEGRKAPTGGEWYLVNIDQTGYYRVNYEESNWLALANELYKNKNTKIPYLSRAQLIDDALNLARTGRLTYKPALWILQGLVNEREHAPWSSAFNGLTYLNRAIFATDPHDSLMMIIRDLVGPAFLDFGITEKDDDTFYDVLTRRMLIEMACSAGHTKCLQDTSVAFSKYLEDNSVLSDTLRDTVAAFGLRGGNAELFNTVLELYEKGTSSYLTYLTYTVDESQINTLVDMTLNSTNQMSAGERRLVLANLASNSRDGLDIVLKTLNETAKDIQELLTLIPEDSVVPYTGNILQLLNSIATRITTEDNLIIFKAIVEQFDLNEDDSNTVTTYVTMAENNRKWCEDNAQNIYTAIKQVVEERDKGGATSIAVSMALVGVSALLAMKNYF